MEAAEREAKGAVHRRGQEAQGAAHEAAPGLQVPSTKEAQDPPQGGLPLQHTLPERAHGRSSSQ